MTKGTLSSEDITDILHPIFDEQIINYGAYNLIFVTGSAVYRNPDIAGQQEGGQHSYLLGYRESPREIVIAPLALPRVEPAGTPISIDTTNVLRTYVLNENTFGIESTNGSSFVLRLDPLVEVEAEAGRGTLEQKRDIEDFQQFLGPWLAESEIDLWR